MLYGDFEYHVKKNIYKKNIPLDDILIKSDWRLQCVNIMLAQQFKPKTFQDIHLRLLTAECNILIPRAHLFPVEFH